MARAAGGGRRIRRTLARLAESRDNVRTRRDRALVLASSSYALRRLNQIALARRRVDDALALLEGTKDYPSDRIALDSEVYGVLHARADQRADEGHGQEAIRRINSSWTKSWLPDPISNTTCASLRAVAFVQGPRAPVPRERRGRQSGRHRCEAACDLDAMERGTPQQPVRASSAGRIHVVVVFLLTVPI